MIRSLNRAGHHDPGTTIRIVAVVPGLNPEFFFPDFVFARAAMHTVMHTVLKIGTRSILMSEREMRALRAKCAAKLRCALVLLLLLSCTMVSTAVKTNTTREELDPGTPASPPTGWHSTYILPLHPDVILEEVYGAAGSAATAASNFTAGQAVHIRSIAPWATGLSGIVVGIDELASPGLIRVQLDNGLGFMYVQPADLAAAGAAGAAGAAAAAGAAGVSGAPTGDDEDTEDVSHILAFLTYFDTPAPSPPPPPPRLADALGAAAGGAASGAAGGAAGAAAAHTEVPQRVVDERVVDNATMRAVFRDNGLSPPPEEEDEIPGTPQPGTPQDRMSESPVQLQAAQLHNTTDAVGTYDALRLGIMRDWPAYKAALELRCGFIGESTQEFSMTIR